MSKVRLEDVPVSKRNPSPEQEREWAEHKQECYLHWRHNKIKEIVTWLFKQGRDNYYHNMNALERKLPSLVEPVRKAYRKEREVRRERAKRFAKANNRTTRSDEQRKTRGRHQDKQQRSKQGAYEFTADDY